MSEIAVHDEVRICDGRGGTITGEVTRLWGRQVRLATVVCGRRTFVRELRDVRPVPDAGTSVCGWCEITAPAETMRMIGPDLVCDDAEQCGIRHEEACGG